MASLAPHVPVCLWGEIIQHKAMSKTLGKMSQCSQGVQCSQGHPSRVFLNRKSRETLFASYEVSKSSMAPGMGHSPRELLGLPRKGILGNKFMGFLGIT